MAQRDCQHLLGRRHFEIERQAGRGLDARQILVANMAPILAQVSGDSVAAASRDDLCGAHRIGMIAAARITDRRDVIDVDPKAQRTAHGLARLPGLVAGIAASSAGTSSAA